MSIADKLIRAKTDYDEVYEAGKKAEYDAFWDVVQDGGNRIDYNMAFASRSWNVDTFKPKYDIVIDGGNRTFYQFNYDTRYPMIDLVELLEKLGITMTFYENGVATVYGLFDSARISRVGVIDITRLQTQSQAYGMFRTSHLVTVDKLIVCEENTLISAFLNATSLRNIVIDGKFGNSVDFKSSPLTKASFTSIINALSSSAIGQTATFNKKAKEAAFTDDEWATLIATKANWTFALV